MPWFRSKKSSTSDVPSLFTVRNSRVVPAEPHAVWNLIRPAEKARLLNPDIVQTFSAPAQPEIGGTIQCFLAVVDGEEQFSAIVVLEEIENRLAVVRNWGSHDPLSRQEYHLAPSGEGTELTLISFFSHGPDAPVSVEKHQAGHHAWNEEYLTAVERYFTGV